MKRLSQDDKRNIELAALFISLFTWIFLAINFDYRLAGVFSVMTIFSILMVMADPRYSKKFHYPLVNTLKVNWLTVSVMTIAGFGIYLASSGVLVSVLLPGFGSLGELVTSTAQDTIPALGGSLKTKMIVYSVMIPITETIAFYRFTEFLGQLTGISLEFDIKNVRLWSLLIANSSLFALFHLSVGLVSGAPTMALSFVFMLVSLWIITFQKQGLEAVLLHILNNTLVFGVFSGSAMAMAVFGLI